MNPGELSAAQWAAPVLAFGVSLLTGRLLLNERIRRLALDHPNDRSLHVTPTPRLGGLAIMLGSLAALMSEPGMAPGLLWAAFFLSVLSLLDDRFDLPVPLRLGAHLLAAAYAALTLLPGAGVALLLVCVLAIGWMTNLYNFMDGSDGLAGGMAVCGFTAYAVAAAWSGEWAWSLGLAAIAAAAAGFLVYNWPPARMFMGDVGSVPLGYLAAAAGVWGWSRGWWTAWFPGVVFAPFVVDASLTLVKRAARGERVWQAHRQHYYQRLVLSGWSKARLLRWELASMALCGVWALATLRLPAWAQTLSLALLGGLIVLCAFWIHRRHPWRGGARNTV